MAWKPPSEIGDTDPLISDARIVLGRQSYGQAAKTEGGDVYTETFRAALLTYAANVNDQISKGKRPLPVCTTTGAFDWTLKKQMQIGQYAPVVAPPEPAFRNIWFYSAPGSGVPWWIGPSFETGKWCAEVLHLNHQPIGYPIGGYLGLMGGDPGLSYNEVIEAEGVELERLLDTNPHAQQALADVTAGRPTDWEVWFSGYSQSADGMEDAVERLFGDGGKYAILRSRINGVLNFGNPSRQKGPTKVGNNPPGWGIARKVRPKWLADLVWSITITSPTPDFYAACDDEIRPLFYAEIVEAETSLSFAEHVIMIAIPVIMNLFGGLGGLLGGGFGGLFGNASGLIGNLISSVGDSDHEDVDQKIINLLSIKGVLTNIPALIKLVMAVPGVQSHGEYHLPKAEFGGRAGIQVACDAVASFRR